MEILTQLILSQINDRQTAEILSVIFIGGAVFCLALGVLMFLNSIFDPVRSRYLRESNEVINRTIGRGYDSKNNIYEKYRHILLPADNELVSRTMQRLHHGGFHYRTNLYQYYALRLVLIIVLPVIAFLILTMVFNVKLGIIFQVIVLMIAIGYIGPSFVLDYLIAKRQKAIQRAFPDALDLLVVCSEAGLSLDAAIQKVTSEIKFSQPLLAEEFSLVIAEIRAGIDRKKAFSNLSDRTGVEEIRGLMSSINQSMRFGSSIAETLRVYSDEFRDKRIQKAEEMAAKIGAKLIFPTAVCLLPCFIFIVIIPFGLNLMQVFSGLKG